MTNTPAEREAAAEKLAERDDHPWRAQTFLHEPTGGDPWWILAAVAIDLQCDLTRTQKQLAEARELLTRLQESREFKLYIGDETRFGKQLEDWLEATR